MRTLHYTFVPGTRVGSDPSLAIMILIPITLTEFWTVHSQNVDVTKFPKSIETLIRSKWSQNVRAGPTSIIAARPRSPNTGVK